MKAFFKFLFVNLGFLTLIFYMVIANELKKIKQDWPKYRCNPAYMFLADNISENYQYCLDKTTNISFNGLSGKLTGLQLAGFDNQSKFNANFSGTIKSSNFATDGIGISLGEYTRTLPKLGVIGTTFSAYFSSITENLQNIVSSIGSSMKAGIGGMGVLDNTFSKYTSFVDKLRK
jgi:hypothetical protein